MKNTLVLMSLLPLAALGESFNVIIPERMPGIASYVVSNETRDVELTPISETESIRAYDVAQGDRIGVYYEPDLNVEIRGENPKRVTIAGAIELPPPQVAVPSYRGRRDVAPYLHEIWLGADWDSLADRACPETPDMTPIFACSGVRSGNFFGRNMDFYLSRMPCFVVHVAGNANRLASVGIGAGVMVEDCVTNDVYFADSYAKAGATLYDGINERGVFISENVVSAGDTGEAGEGTNPGALELGLVYVPRYVLDHATNAVHAIELLKARNVVGDMMGYAMHYMIGDPNETYVVEIIGTELVARKMDIMTNFYLNWDNGNRTKVTDETNGWTKADYPAPYDPAVSIDDINARYSPGSIGVERFIYLRDHLNKGKTFEGMFELLKDVRYTKMYDFDVEPSVWITENCMPQSEFGGQLTITNLYAAYKYDYVYCTNFLDETFMAIGRDVREDIESYRDQGLELNFWLTTHNSTYDIENRLLQVVVQEDYDHRFLISLDDTEPPKIWEVGEGVKAQLYKEALTITGAGKINDFASAAELPWAGLSVKDVTLAAGVTPGKNTYAGLADATTLNGTVPISLLRASAADFVLGNLSPAEATALKVENGEVKLTVEVDESADLKTWKPVTTVELAIPAEGEKGYYILKSR